MFGLDDHVAHLSDGATFGVVAIVAVLLGLRHATDPDHLAAVTTLIAGGRERSARVAARLGLSWGAGHATTLFAFGLPIVLFQRFLPERAQQAAETSVGILIVGLAVWLLVRWRRGMLHAHPHTHRRARSPLQAYAIGLVHGIGGSAGVGVLLLATVDSRTIAVLALAILAVFTALSMTLVTTGFGFSLDAAPVRAVFARIAPALGAVSLGFGVWYSLAALEIAPYYF